MSINATCSRSRSTTDGPYGWRGRSPTRVVKVAESGVRGADDARMLRDAGYDAILVGETLVTAADPRSTLTELRQ